MEALETKSNLRMIVAVNNLGYIGLDGGIPWRCSADLKHFKRLTEGHKCILGRTTFEKLPPLKNRELFVVGSTYHTMESAIQSVDDGWVIGGNMIYEYLLDRCTELHISIINDDTVGDTKFLGNICSNWKQLIHSWIFAGSNRSLHIYNFEPNPPKLSGIIM